MKMTAAVLYEHGLPEPFATSQPLKIERVDIEAPGENELLIEIRGGGLCHSDLAVLKGERKRKLPMVMGHEAAGVVREVGRGVHDIKVDDHVVMAFVPSCGHCKPCVSGRSNLCASGFEARNNGTLQTGFRRIRKDGVELNHQSGVSGFAEYAVVYRGSAVKVDKRLPLDIAAIYGCAVMTGVGAVVNTARVPVGATVAVVGLGGVGLNALLGCVVAGAARIVAIDINEKKLELAQSLGATDGFLASDPACAEKVRAATGGGVDYAFETAGSVKALQVAYDVCARGGVTVTAGMSAEGQTFTFPHMKFVIEARSILASYMGGCHAERDIPRFAELYLRGKLPVDRLRSATIGFDQINVGFDRLARGEVVRQVLTPHG
ncbi:MAG: alcohol dehydrogenase [Alphaproteobacteria bacterium]|nr:alcohol dehydrogenase [Alphaproteobacteria bacterium]